MIRSPGESGETVQEPAEPGESGESLTVSGESKTVSSEERDAVILAVSALVNEGKPLSREAIKQHLGWNNKKHWIVKAVCDEYSLC